VSYPAHLASDVVLRDGSTVALRPVEQDDEQLLLEFFASLDERSLAFRFFTGAPNLKEVAQTLAAVDQTRRFGLLALRGPEQRPVGHGFYAAIDDERAEVAFAVSPELQGHGLGTILLAQLAERAAEVGFTTLVADVLTQNHRMVSMFRHSGLPVVVHSEPGALVVEMPSSGEPEAIARFQEHDTIAARAAVAALLDSRAVAVVDEPPSDLSAWIGELAAGGIRAVIVRGELSDERAEELLATCRATGTRLVGPGSLGIVDNRFGAELNLTPTDARPTPGGVGIVAQGGAASRNLLAAATRRDIGVSTFASLGDRADISANDLLEYWEDDQATRVALLQVESFSDPRRFARVARRFGARKPIVVLAEEDADEPPGRGLFDQVGAIRVDSIDGALNVAEALAERSPGRSAGRDPVPSVTLPEARSDEAAALLAEALGRGEAELGQTARARLLDCYGIEMDEATGHLDAAAALRVTVEADPIFGPVMRCGPVRGPDAECPARLCPLDADDAAGLLDPRHLAGAQTLAPTLRAAAERALEALAAAAARHAEIATLTIEPLLLVPGRGAVAGGARIVMRRPPERRPWPRTWE
jgi:succinyl-CoA synthetase alpha subunit/RimJ/RimL family protein N-acetyltransferase